MAIRRARSRAIARSAGRGFSLPTSSARARATRLSEGETIGLPYGVDEIEAEPPSTRRSPSAGWSSPRSVRGRGDPAPRPGRRGRLREIPFARALGASGSRARHPVPFRLSKTGQKPIYLSAAAQAVLAALPRLAFNPHRSSRAPKRARRGSTFMQAMGGGGPAPPGSAGFRIHDLRHSFASAW